MGEQSFTSRVHGYDPDEVDAALTARDQRIAELEREAGKLSAMMVEQERRLQSALAAEQERSRAATGGSLGPVTRRIEEAGALAREGAARIRTRALGDAVRFADRLLELTQLQEELGDRFGDLAERAGVKLETTGEDPYRDPAGDQKPGAGKARRPDQKSGGDQKSDWTAFAARSTHGATPPPADGHYSGAVEIEVGPLRDFAQLTALEDAVGAIEGISEVSVLTFSGERAQLALTLTQPVHLIEALRLRVPAQLVVRALGGDWMELDIASPRGNPVDGEQAA